jgi:hypothetical protein
MVATSQKNTPSSTTTTRPVPTCPLPKRCSDTSNRICATGLPPAGASSLSTCSMLVMENSSATTRLSPPVNMTPQPVRMALEGPVDAP